MGTVPHTEGVGLNKGVRGSLPFTWPQDIGHVSQGALLIACVVLAIVYPAWLPLQISVSLEAAQRAQCLIMRSTWCHTTKHAEESPGG